MKIGPVADNPLAFLAAYTLRNDVVLWAFERGLLDEFCPKCRGRGFTCSRPCGCVENGCTRWDDAASRMVTDPALPCTIDDPCRHCRRECPRLRPSRPPVSNDIHDADDLAVARVLGIRVDMRKTGLR